MSRDWRVNRLKALRAQHHVNRPGQPDLDLADPVDAQSGEGGRAGLIVYDWYAEFEELAERYTWKIAAYIAWVSSPRVGRKPATQMEFAQLIGFKNDRMIRRWREQQPEIVEEIKRVQASPLLSHRRDIYEALIDGALDPRYGHADRKLALELMGDYKQVAPPDDGQLGFGFTADDAAQAQQELDDWSETNGA